ncbi:thioredoxin fold domain-containing protein [Acidithiobacillus sp. M4-SHS-6]|uniref:thioredoxin fold domain-containing protein n=1 Tax=Acidithiobacillus sp. M4-SHS-6 TaxID=3383024 RepID=UPI0039BE2504
MILTKMIRNSVLLTGGFLLAGCATTSNLKPAEHLVEQNFHGQVHVSKVFPGPVQNLTGIVVETDQHQQGILWMLADKYLLLGPVINDRQQNITAHYADKYLPHPPKVPAEKIAPAALTAPGFTIGHAGPLMVVFMDPNCIFCHLLWEALQQPVDEGKVRVKVVPVGFLKPSSPAKAATILAAKNPAEAWANNEKGFNMRTEEGSTQVLRQIPEKDKAAVKINTQLLHKTGETATPTLLYCIKTPKGLEMQMKHGIDVKRTPEFVQKLDGSVGARGCIPGA